MYLFGNIKKVLHPIKIHVMIVKILLQIFGKEAVAMTYRNKAHNFISNKTTDRRNQLFSLESV